jgi:hypothetical protein
VTDEQNLYGVGTNPEESTSAFWAAARSVRAKLLSRLRNDDPEVSLLCPDCGIHAWRFEEDDHMVHEDFYVSAELWDSVCPDDKVRRYVRDGIEYGQGNFAMCIGCFEKRLGRELTRRDLTVEPDDLFGTPPSRRFRNRWANPGTKGQS